MSGNVYDELKERGFIAQVSDETAVRKMLDEKRIKPDDLIVFIGGGHKNVSQHTNLIQIETPAMLLKQ